MILKALADYYQRLADDPNVDIAPPGWFQGKLSYLVVLDSKGCFVKLGDLRQRGKTKLVGRPTLLPFIGKQALKHTNSGKDANLLWDNSSFVFGLGNKGDLKIESFISTLRSCLGSLKDTGVAAVIAFLESGKQNASVFAPILEDPSYGEDIVSGGPSCTFALDGDEHPFIFSRPDVARAVSSIEVSSDAPVGTCLITGMQNQPLEECHPVVKGVYGAGKDPNLVSFNEAAYLSYGKKQSVNAPSSKKAVFAYTTALNYLLASEEQRMRVGDATTVFWASDPCDFESGFQSCFVQRKGEEAVSYAQIRGLLNSAKTGIAPSEAKIPFYVLGLVPFGPRLAVRFWYDGNVKNMKERVVEHFADTEMVRRPHDPEFLSMERIVLATTRQSAKHPFGDADDIAPHLVADMFAAVLKGLRYPQTVLQKVVNRVKAEQSLCDSKGRRLENVTFARASIIKGVLARNARLSKSKEKEVGMSLDREYDNIGYVLGRLFAVLERIQEEAHKPAKLNKTIRDTYFGGAASSPQVVFKRLQDLSMHHLSKIRNAGKSTVWLEKALGEIMALMPKEGVPTTLKLEDQGRFSVGYYHQRQDFFMKKEAKNTEEENTNE